MSTLYLAINHPHIHDPTPDVTLSDAIVEPTAPPVAVPAQAAYPWLIGILALVVLLGILGFLRLRKTH